MKKILVTGGCGYIGSHTIVALLQKGYKVLSIDSLERGKEYVPDRVKEITGKMLLNYRRILGNVKATRAIFKENPDIAGVIHFAAYKQVGESVERPLRYYVNNLTSLFDVLMCMRESKIPNFIFSSSSAVYGDVSKLPVQEDSPVTEQTSPYGRSKYFGEKIIEDLASVHSFKALMLRYFNPAGSHESALIGEPPEENPLGIVPALTATAAGRLKEFVVNGSDYPTRDGTCIRDYVHVMDVAEAHVMALEFLMSREESSYLDVINLGTGNGVSVLEMIKAFESANQMALPYKFGPRRAGDVMSVYSDISKAKKLLGWQPARSVEEMMRSAWKWEETNKANVASVTPEA